uniref:Molecular chaperone DnaK n=1 Tax=Panagrellus redivivus TaxID=6233 RepID=A0A7E4ZRF9_PANRE
MVNAIGIDLGTSKCCVGVFRNGKVEIIPDEFGNRMTPSYVSFTFNGLRFGADAKSELYSWYTIFPVLRLVGRKFDDPVVQSSLENTPFPIRPAKNGHITLEVDVKDEKKRLYPEEIVAMLLVRLKQSADAFLEADVKDVVISTSGQLGLRFRRAIFDAAEIAGLNVLRIVNSSTVAAIGHFFGKEASENRNDLIVNFGGGNLDVSVVSVKDGQPTLIIPDKNSRFSKEELLQMTESTNEYMINKKTRHQSKPAKDRLTAYCNRTIETVEENKRKRKALTPEDQQAYKKCKDALVWIDRNPRAETEDVQRQQVLLEWF